MFSVLNIFQSKILKCSNELPIVLVKFYVVSHPSFILLVTWVCSVPLLGRNKNPIPSEENGKIMDEHQEITREEHERKNKYKPKNGEVRR